MNRSAAIAPDTSQQDAADILDALVRIVETDPYPADHTSSFWQDFGARNWVERRDGQIVLESFGIGYVNKRPLGVRWLNVVERWSYRGVTAQLSSFDRSWALAKVLAADLGCGLTYDVWKYSVILAVLADHWQTHHLSPTTFAVIGDGHGFLGALVRRFVPGAHLYCIDLPKTLAFQLATQHKADPRAILALISGGDGARTADVSFVLPQAVEAVSDTIDCAINIASMQEMNAFSIASYFAFLRRRSGPQSRFYCVNRERKALPGGEVSTFAEYPWRPDDEVFLDGPCLYYRHFFDPRTLPHGPRVLGVRVPFVNYFDGLHLHRLVRLASLK